MSEAQIIHDTYASDSLVTKHLAWKPNKNLEDTQVFLTRAIESWRKGSEYVWLMTQRNGTVTGSIGIRPDGPKVEIGYGVGRQYCRKGYATEACSALIKWALNQKQVYRIWATCDIDNKASARVLEKLGMTCEGVLRKWLIRPQFGRVPRDCLCYSITRSG